MGMCISKRERNRVIYSADESVDEATLESARVFARGDYATRVANQELSSYNVFFDEWGARFIESGSRRWHVIHMPGTAKFVLQEDKGKNRDLAGQAHLYSKEVYGDMSFSSYLSSSLMNVQASCPASTARLPNLLDAKNNASLLVESAEKSPIPFGNANQLLNTESTSRNSSVAASLSGDLKLAFEADQRNSWIPVLTVERAHHPASSQEMISIEMRKHAATSCIEAEGVKNLSSAISQDNMMAGVKPSTMTSTLGEIGVFNAEKYFKANDRQRADHEVGLASNDMHESGPAVLDKNYSATSSAPGSEIQDDYQYCNSTAASSDVSYDSRSALSGARKVASSDAMWSSSPCNSRNNSCNKRSNYRVHTFSRKGCRWSFCTGKSAVDAKGEPGFVMSARPKRCSIKVQDSLKFDSTSAYTAAPIMTKLELPKSSQQGKHSRKIMNELPQPLSPSAKHTNLLFTVETGKPKSFDYASTLSTPHSNSTALQNQEGLPSKFLSTCTPGPMWVQSSGQHQQSMVSEVLQLGQDQMLGDDSLPVLQSTSVGRFMEDSSDGYIRNAEYSSMDNFRQQSSAITQGHGGPSVRNPTEWKVSMPGSISTAPLSCSKADDGASSVSGAGQKLAQVRPHMPSAPHCEMGLSAWNKDPGLAQRRSKKADISECIGEFVPSIQVMPWHAEKEAAVTRDQRIIDKGENWAGTRNVDELLVIGHSNTSMQVMGGKNHFLHKAPECFTFPNLVCLPSSLPLEEKKQGIHNPYKDHSSEKEQGIQQLQKHPSSEQQQDIQHLFNNYCSKKEQGVQHLLEEQSIQNNYKNPSSEEEQGIQQIYENYSLSLGNPFIGTCVWSTEDEALERASSPSGASTPTSSSGGAGSAFGSPFSVAASCPRSDYRSRDELIKRLRSFSHQSQSHEGSIPASISSTFSSNEEPSNLFNASCSSSLNVNQNLLHATGAKKFTDVVHYLLGDRFAYRHALGNASYDHVLPHDKQNPQGDVIEHNTHRLALQMGDECVRKEELNEIGSDSSSDLFDLDSLVGCGEGADHGLPVFEMRNESSCMLPGSLFTVSDSSLYKGFNSSVVLVAGDEADIGIPITSMQLHERLDASEGESTGNGQSIEGMRMLMQRRLTLLS